MTARNNNTDLTENIFLKTWRPYVWIIALGFIIYAQTLSFNFTYLDDNALIVDNYHVLKNISNIFQVFKQDVFRSSVDAYYRPVLTVSFMLDAQLGGAAPFIYHLANTLIHLLASCLLFILLVKLRYSAELAFFCSLIFTVHPVLTQAVAWIPGRNDSLLAVFVLLAFIAFMNFIETKNWAYYFWHIFFFTLALFTKESAPVLALMCLLYLHLIIKEKLISFNKGILTIGWVVIITFWFLMRMNAFRSPFGLTTSELGQSLWANFPAAIQFIGKSIFPFNLSVLPLIKDTTFIYGCIALITLAGLIFLSKKRRYNYVAFGASWFILFLLPTLFFHNPSIPFGLDFHLEHRMYLPLIGLIIVLLETDLIKGLDFKNKKAWILGALVILLFSALTYNHSSNFKNRLSFWKKASETSPHSPLAHRNLGAMYYLSGKYDNAETEYKKALELSPNEPMVHNNLGLIYMNRGRLKDAEIEFLKEYVINPLWDNLHYNLGLLYAREGRLKEAEAQWKKTLEINPDHADALYRLAVYYYGEKDYALARRYILEARKRGVQIDPDFIKAIDVKRSIPGQI